MPMYDYRCTSTTCDTVFEALRKVGTVVTECPECGSTSDRVWVTKPATIIGDECDLIQENGLSTPRRFTSKAERRRALKEAGCYEAVRHVGVPGTDKSPVTTSWSAIAPGTLEAARKLLERVGGVAKSDEQLSDELDDAVHTGEVGVELEVAPGRTLGLKIGSVYHGVLDHSILKENS